MKNIKMLFSLLAVLAVGSLAFSATPAENYLSKFETLVTSAETYAKNSDGSKLISVQTQKTGIDALRKTVTLSTMQRFTDWRLTKRYDSAVSKMQKAASSSTSAATKTTSAVGSALGSAASEVGGAIKETATKTANSVKDTGKKAVEDVKSSAQKKIGETENGAKKKVDDKVQETTDKVTGKIKEGADKVTNALNNFLNSDSSKDD